MQKKYIGWVFCLLLILMSPLAARAQVESARPWLGIAIDQGKTGVLVKEILPETPAAAAGLQAGDEITAINTRILKTPEDLITTVQAQGIGHTIKVQFVRGDKTQIKEVKLVAKPDALELLQQRYVGKPAPLFDLPVVHGAATGKLEALKGKVVILEFWATWCVACVSTHKRLSELAVTHKSKNLVVLAISDEPENLLKTYAASNKPAFTLLHDNKKAYRDWSVSAIPMIAVIDKTGKVAFATIGSGSYLEEAISAALKLVDAK